MTMSKDQQSGPESARTNTLVNALNPKLQQFNNPFCLAMVILVLTAVLFTVTFAILMVDCPVLPFDSMEISTMEGIKRMVNAGQLSCLQMVFYLHHDAQIGMVKGTACTPGPSDVEWEWCSSSLDAEGASVDGPLMQQYADKGLPDCIGAAQDGSHLGDLYGFYYDKRVCRNASDAFSAALAYTTYIEVCVTLLVLLVGTKMGKVQLKSGDSDCKSLSQAVKVTLQEAAKDDDSKKKEENEMAKLDNAA